MLRLVAPKAKLRQRQPWITSGTIALIIDVAINPSVPWTALGLP